MPPRGSGLALTLTTRPPRAGPKCVLWYAQDWKLPSVDSPPLSRLRQKGLMVPIPGQVAQSGKGLPWGHTQQRVENWDPELPASLSLCTRLWPPPPSSRGQGGGQLGSRHTWAGQTASQSLQAMQRSSPDGYRRSACSPRKRGLSGPFSNG